MPKVDKGLKADGSWHSRKSAESGKFQAVKTDGESVLTQQSSKVSKRSDHVLKAVSSAHSDALKRLKPAKCGTTALRSTM